MSNAPEISTAAAHVRATQGVALIDATLGAVLRGAAARFPRRRALAWLGRDGALCALTYEEFLAEAEAIAFWLLAHAPQGARIAPWSRNTAEWALLEFGCALAGMVVAAWNPGWTDFECSSALDLTEPTLVFAGHDVRGRPLLERAQAIAGDTRVIALDQLRELARGCSARELPCPAPSDPCLVQFTSGTTGRAKGAELSHFAVVNAAWIRLRALRCDENDVFLNAIPLNHIGGSVIMLPGAVLSGGCYVVIGRFEASEYLHLMRVTGATRIGGVPTTLLALMEHADWQPSRFKVRSVGVGGAQVPQALVERLIRELSAPVSITYAQSESPIISLTLLDDPPHVLANTVGRALPSVELKIVRMDGSTCARDEVGEICVRSPVVMSGYYGQPEATRAVVDLAGFLHTGDLGALDAEGYLRVTGRRRDVIIRGGENIYPSEVEDALLTHPDVLQACVVGTPDPRWGQTVSAAVQMRGARQPTAEELEAHASLRVAHFKVPRRWLFVDSFPLTPNGKIAKVQVEQLFDARLVGGRGA